MIVYKVKSKFLKNKYKKLPDTVGVVLEGEVKAVIRNETKLKKERIIALLKNRELIGFKTGYAHGFEEGFGLGIRRKELVDKYTKERVEHELEEGEE